MVGIPYMCHTIFYTKALILREALADGEGGGGRGEAETDGFFGVLDLLLPGGGVAEEGDDFAGEIGVGIGKAEFLTVGQAEAFHGDGGGDDGQAGGHGFEDFEAGAAAGGERNDGEVGALIEFGEAGGVGVEFHAGQGRQGLHRGGGVPAGEDDPGGGEGCADEGQDVARKALRGQDVGPVSEQADKQEDGTVFRGVTLRTGCEWEGLEPGNSVGHDVNGGDGPVEFQEAFAIFRGANPDLIGQFQGALFEAAHFAGVNFQAGREAAWPETAGGPLGGQVGFDVVQVENKPGRERPEVREQGGQRNALDDEGVRAEFADEGEKARQAGAGDPGFHAGTPGGEGRGFFAGHADSDKFDSGWVAGGRRAAERLDRGRMETTVTGPSGAAARAF